MHCAPKRTVPYRETVRRQNPCKKGLAVLPEDYEHSSASYYFTGLHRNCAVITYMELQDIDLGGF